VVEKHEFEDHLPGIYERAIGVPYPGRPLDEHLPLGPEMIETLREVVGDDRLHFELVRELLDIEQRHRAQARRAGLFEALERSLRRGFYDNERDATLRAQQRKTAMDRTATSVADEPDPLDLADGYVRAASIEVVQ
jgi:DNA sulfur modification protein DndC